MADGESRWKKFYQDSNLHFVMHGNLQNMISTEDARLILANFRNVPLHAITPRDTAVHFLSGLTIKEVKDIVACNDSGKYDTFVRNLNGEETPKLKFRFDRNAYDQTSEYSHVTTRTVTTKTSDYGGDDAWTEYSIELEDSNVSASERSPLKYETFNISEQEQLRLQAQGQELPDMCTSLQLQCSYSLPTLNIKSQESKEKFTEELYRQHSVHVKADPLTNSIHALSNAEHESLSVGTVSTNGTSEAELIAKSLAYLYMPNFSSDLN